MKVMFINTVCGRGSTGRMISELGAEIEKNGGEYLVAYGRGNDNDPKHSYAIDSPLDSYIHALAARLTDRSGFYSLRATNQLLNKIREFAPDIIHLHNLHGYYLHVERLFDFLKNEYAGKVIWTLHDCWAFTGHCVHFTYAECDRWKNGCFDCPEKHEYPATMFLDNSRQNYEAKKNVFLGMPNLHIVAVSEWLKSVVEQSFLRQYNISRIYNGIDMERFRYVDNKIKEEHGITGKMVLLISDGWNERKGFGFAKAVAGEAPKDWTFVLIGADKSQLKDLPENMIGIERIWNQEKLIQYYSAADVFFNPSIEETFGLVTVEAMACGTPAVVKNSTACPELVVEGISGKVIPADVSTVQCVEALSEAMEIKTSRNVAMGFSLDAQQEQYYSLYSAK